jgi:transposase
VVTVGIDIGGRSHAVARCREGLCKADREILRLSQSRAGFAAFDAWLDRQAEPVTLVTMESSGHYWMPIASHLRRRDVPVAVVNPLAAKYFAKSRLARTKSDPADARSLAEMAMRDTPPARDPLAGAELRQAARFAMTLVTEQAKVCQRLIRLVEIGFPELGELFDDPACRTARAVLRIAPTARAATRRRTSTLANANAGPGHRRCPGRGAPRR